LKHLMILFCLMLATAIAQPSRATNLTVTCTPAIKNSDGSAFAPNAVQGFNLYGAYTGSPLVLLTSSATCSFVRQNVNPGSIVYAVTQTESLAGIVAESAQTSPITTIVPPPPPAPGGVTVSLATTSTIAYMLVPGNDTFGVLIVGTVPLATACDATQLHTVNGVAYYVVPHSSVTLTGPITKLTATLANCS
jgi:hypothetical protein